MVLHIVLPEPTTSTNEINHYPHRQSSNFLNKYPNYSNGTLKWTNPAISTHQNLPEHEEIWLRRSGSINSFTDESRIGEDSLFNYEFGRLGPTTTGGGGKFCNNDLLRPSSFLKEDLKPPPTFCHYPDSSTPGCRPEAPPTPKEDKKSMFKGYLTVILSCIYAIFILMLGVVVYIADLITRKATIAELFSVYLLIMGLLWLIFLYCDIRRHQNLLRKERSRLLQNRIWLSPESKRFPEFLYTTKDNNIQSSSFNQSNPIPHKNRNLKQRSVSPPSSSSSPEDINMMTGSSSSTDTISHVTIQLGHLSSYPLDLPVFKYGSYTFCKSRHSGSFYLKIGAAGFCFGQLIHSGLLLCRQIIFFTSEDPKVFDRCANVTNLILEVLFPIYSFLLLFVIFKYSNVIINRHQELSRFALMHCISSSLCFWFWSILRETADSLYHKMLEHNTKLNSHHSDSLSYHHQYHHLHNDLYAQSSSQLHNLSRQAGESLESLIAFPLTAYIDEGVNDKREHSVFDFLNATSAIASIYDPCVEFSPISEIVLKMSPYLYPFSIEYSILIVGVLFIMWQNIGKGEESRRRRRFRPQSQYQRNRCRIPSPLRDDSEFPPTSFTNNLVIHADCHSANKGLFAGLLILVGTVVSVIIFYVALDESRSGLAAQWVNMTSQGILLILMIVTVLIAYRQITKLDVNTHPVSLLDDLLLFLCLPSFFLYTIFMVVPAMALQDYYAVLVCILQVIQVILQTPCIIDGLRRCSNTEKLRQEKPGRELITFLIVCNIAMWVIETFEIKSAYAQHEQISFYGSILWTLLSHMTLPLTLFYRFHSSVCLVDIWKSAYESGE